MNYQERLEQAIVEAKKRDDVVEAYADALHYCLGGPMDWSKVNSAIIEK